MITGLLLLAAVAGCFALGLRGRSTPWLVAGTAATVVALTVFNQFDSDEYPVVDDLVFFTLLLGTPALLGRILRRRADLIAELAARADVLRAAQADQAAAAVAEERARLAIAVHDALAHRVGEISLQAAGAARVAGDAPGRALEALARIEETARAALDDIREAIGVLRHGDAGATLAPPSETRDAVPAPWRAAEPAPPVADDERGVLDRRGDELLAAAVFVAIAVELAIFPDPTGPRIANILGAALIAAPLAVRRRWPLGSAAAVYAACGLQALLLTPITLLVTPIVLLIVPPYTVAAHLPRRAALAGLALCVVGSLALEPGVATGLIGLLAWAAGRAVRDRVGRARELDALNAELERTGDAHAARARGEERLRVARELHDAVAHSMTVIVLQAGAAQRVWAKDRAAAGVAVEALTGVARDTLAELRATLRAEPDTARTGLDELAARVRPAGVEVTIDRDPGDLPPEVEQVANAVVQEALTNVARHAAPTAVRVRVAREDEAVVVTVTDGGRAPGAAPAADVLGTGTGLRGMAERVAAAGGELSFGADGAGFRVEARLPLRETVVA